MRESPNVPPPSIQGSAIAKCPAVDFAELRETLRMIEGLRRLGVEVFDRPYSLMPPLDSAFGRKPRPNLGTGLGTRVSG